ncbi:MAG: hypothetical protein ACFFCS_19320 [Candidatus Hodarchaeota archaeon]
MKTNSNSTKDRGSGRSASGVYASEREKIKALKGQNVKKKKKKG